MIYLPEHLKFNIYQIYFRKIVLKELNTKPEFKMCLNCCYHGIPCANCYDYKYEGNLGPGNIFGKQFVHVDDISSVVLCNIVTWVVRKPYKDVYNTQNISNHINLPQHIFS